MKPKLTNEFKSMLLDGKASRFFKVPRMSFVDRIFFRTKKEKSLKCKVGADVMRIDIGGSRLSIGMYSRGVHVADFGPIYFTKPRGSITVEGFRYEFDVIIT